MAGSLVLMLGQWLATLKDVLKKVLMLAVQRGIGLADGSVAMMGYLWVFELD